MLKKKAIRKIIITTFSIITIFAICIMPSKINNDENFLNPGIDTTYVDNSETIEIYLLGPNNYLVKTSILITSDDIEDKIKQIIKCLIVNKNSKIPDGLKAIIPSNTKLNNISLDDKVVILDFDEELLNVEEELEERLIEAITYSLINLDGIEGLQIKINGVNLLQLPKTKKNLPQVLNRNFGINKVFEIDSIHDVNKITMYYINNINNKNYYVPVTKYLNDERDKIKIIIDNLSSNYIYESSLVSFLNSSTELINYEIEDKTMKLNFNQGIFTNDKILEEVIYPISQSVFENYDLVELVLFQIEDQTITSVERKYSVK